MSDILALRTSLQAACTQASSRSDVRAFGIDPLLTVVIEFSVRLPFKVTDLNGPRLA